MFFGIILIGDFMYKKMVIFTIIFIFLDQITKGLINLYMNLNDSINIINNFFSLTYVHNYGAAFSMFDGARYIFIIIAIIALNLIYIYFIKNKDLKNFEIVIYSLLLSGIVGNLIDRVIYGYVIDFLDFIIFGYDFAIFNIADCFIVISVILLLILEVKNARICSRKK